jgi:hypothetical protein
MMRRSTLWLDRDQQAQPQRIRGSRELPGVASVSLLCLVSSESTVMDGLRTVTLLRSQILLPSPLRNWLGRDHVAQ